MGKQLKTLLVCAALIIVALVNVGCAKIINTRAYSNVEFKIVEAETGKPIEGAVLLVQWTQPSILSTNTNTNYKVVEKLSDQDGKVKIPGVIKIGVNKPKLVAYKKGYVAWRHDYIFPDYTRKTDFKWRNGYLIELEEFKSEYTYRDHVSFIRGGYSSGVSYGLFQKAWDWETELKDMGK